MEDFEILKEKEKALQKELEDFKKEKEQIRQVIGSIGGKAYSNRDLIINLTFLFIIIVFFTIGTLMHLDILPHIVPSAILIEISILLVSIKIVWMIHSQHKVYHFQFWILSSIEFRISEMIKSMKNLKDQLKEHEKK